MWHKREAYEFEWGSVHTDIAHISACDVDGEACDFGWDSVCMYMNGKRMGFGVLCTAG